MKILKIEFQNINSLKGTHEIDFSKPPFTVSSLFAITGPTGSGKSTILDVISLALFNRIPRMPGNKTLSKTDILKFGAVLTRNQKEAFAKITYQTKTGNYISKWEISTARTGNLRDHEMEIFDLSTGNLLDLKKSEVPSKNEELIGLTYEQFIKAVLLAQGEFAQLLKAEKKERGELLEKITGTGIYRQLGMKAFQKFKLVNAKIEDRQREISLLQIDLLEKEDLEDLKKTLAENTAACIHLKKELEVFDKRLQLKENIQEQSRQIYEKDNLRKSAASRLQDFENKYLDQLQKHEQVQVFAEDLREWKILNKSCSELKEELAAHGKQEQENLQGINSCLENITTFLKTEPETEKIETRLQEFTQNVRKLQRQREEKRSKYDNLKERFHSEVRDVPFKLNGNLESEELKLKDMKKTGERNLQDLKEKLNGLDLENSESEKIRLQQDIQLGRRAHQKASKIHNLYEVIEKTLDEEKELLLEVEQLPKQIEFIGAKSATLRERLDKLHLQRENEILKASLKEHRHNLRDGEPCPLCGAKEHPYANELPPKNNKLQQEISATQIRFDQLERKISSFSTSLTYHQKRLTIIQKDLEEKQEELQVHQIEFKKQFSQLNPSDGNWEQFCSSREEKLQLLEKFEKEKRRVRGITEGLPTLKEIKEVLVQGKEIKAELDSLYTGSDIDTDCLDLQKSWTGLQHQKLSLSNLFRELNLKLESKSAEMEAAEKSLQPRITAIDCKEIKEAMQRLLPETKYSELRKEWETLTSQIGQIEASLKTLKEQLAVLKQKDVEETATVLNEKMTSTKIQLEEISGKCEELRRKQRNDTDRNTRIATIESELEGAKKETRRWKLLDDLIGDSKGNRFNDFAQDLSLSQLLILANRRLKDLSDRYRIDKSLIDEDDSLVAIDDHMGAQRRSVKTLSGGETFILSLSMALALSDLASRNVEINSLFIDEGFGTLDPETLDQTLDTLEKLQAESSKTIGIISHVDSLKERIATQIQLKRHGQGYSTLEVKG